MLPKSSSVLFHCTSHNLIPPNPPPHPHLSPTCTSLQCRVQSNQFSLLLFLHISSLLCHEQKATSPHSVGLIRKYGCFKTVLKAAAWKNKCFPGVHTQDFALALLWLPICHLHKSTDILMWHRTCIFHPDRACRATPIQYMSRYHGNLQATKGKCWQTDLDFSELNTPLLMQVGNREHASLIVRDESGWRHGIRYLDWEVQGGCSWCLTAIHRLFTVLHFFNLPLTSPSSSHSPPLVKYVYTAKVM